MAWTEVVHDARIGISAGPVDLVDHDEIESIGRETREGIRARKALDCGKYILSVGRVVPAAEFAELRRRGLEDTLELFDCAVHDLFAVNDEEEASWRGLAYGQSSRGSFCLCRLRR